MMLAEDLPSRQKNLVVVPQDTPVVLAESGGRALALVLPPLDDLAAIAELRSRQYSVLDSSVANLAELQYYCRVELTRLQKNADRFAKSATYFNRIANLALIAGDYEEEARNLRRANELSTDVFFAHRLAENLIARNRVEDAEALFSSLDLAKDAFANLRLAFFHVQRREIPAAEERVEHALRIDPLDFSANLFRGGLFLVTGQFRRAIQSFRIAGEARETPALYVNMAVAYIRSSLMEKALSALKKAVALDPLSVSAVILLADLAFRERRNEEALPSLRYFVQFDERNTNVWSRLARASLHLGMRHEAIAALKRQASFGETSAIWNNLGVAYQFEGDRKRALQNFKQAVLAGEEAHGYDYFLAARNFAQALLERGEREVVLEFIGSVLAYDKSDVCLTDDDLSDLYVINLATLNRMERQATVADLSEKLLARPRISIRLVSWLVNSLISYYALVSGSVDRSRALAEKYESVVTVNLPKDSDRRIWFFNNVSFAFAEFGEVDRAEYYLSKISYYIHKMPYPTATLGLIHVRRGHIERGTELYREAVGLCVNDLDKNRIRQKLDLELGRYWLAEKPQLARSHLERVVERTGGESALVDSAKRLLGALSHDSDPNGLRAGDS